MEDEVTILGIAGSIRRGSYNRGLLVGSQQLVPAGAKFEIFEDLAQIPIFNQDHELDPPNVVSQFKSRIRQADAIVFATPEYNYSVPGVLKNAIDWASRPYGDSAWSGKPVAVMGASPGTLGTVRAQNHLRQMFVFLDMYAVNRPEVMVTNAHERIDQNGNITDEATRNQVRQLLYNLVEWTRRLNASRVVAAG